MLRSFPCLLLATLLLAPVGVSAQASAPVKAPPQTVSIQAAFVSVSAADLDALGINFDLRLLSFPPHTFLAFAKGNIVPQLYQTLARTRGKVVLAAPVTASDNSPVTIVVDTEVYAPLSSPTAADSNLLFPQLVGALRVQGKLTLIPHILPGNAVSLDIVSQAKSNDQERLITVPSGQQIVLLTPLLKKPEKNSTSQDRPMITGASGRMKALPDTQELLIFITPTNLSAGVNAGNITGKP